MLPIRHGKHRLLDTCFPRPWIRDSTLVILNYKGADIYIDVDDLVGWHFAIMQSFDPEVAEVLLAAASRHSEDVFWDIGANKGTCSYEIASKLPQAKIVAIEPQVALRRNCELNLQRICPDRFEYYQVGIGTKEEYAELSIPSDNIGKASLSADISTANDRRETVRIVPATKIVNESKFGWPTLVKIDVEGYEPHVIQSIAPAFQNRQCNAVVFENHWRRSDAFESIRKVADAFGYDIFGIRKSTFATSLLQASSPMSGITDYLMVRREFRVESSSLNLMIQN